VPGRRSTTPRRRGIRRRRRSRRPSRGAREPGSAARSAYADTIERLEAVFDASRIHYCFFEDLRDRPVALSADLLRFLGVAPIALELPRAVNVAAGSKAVPSEFARALAGDYLPTVERLCQRFDGPPHAWRARYAQRDSADDRPR
jgi:hypothetical protein